MGTHARVTDIKTLAQFRPALIRFGEDAERALTSTGSDAMRILSWLQHDRMTHWKREIRERSEQAVRANTKLIQQTSSENPRPSVDARQEYERAKARVRDAEEKYDQTRMWARRLEQEIENYRSTIEPLATIARSEMREAASVIGAQIEALEQYAEPRTPPSQGSGAARATDDATDDAEEGSEEP